MTEQNLNKLRIKIAKLVTSKRIKLGITQVQLAEATGMGIATIQRFESGRFWISTKHYVLICDALHIKNIFDL